MSNERFLKTLRIFIACPGDVSEEKKRVLRVIARRQEQAERNGYVLKALEWTQCTPDLGNPQRLIFQKLDPDSWDLVVFIFWTRFGQPTGNVDPSTGVTFPSGTYEEFCKALQLCLDRGCPCVWVYRGMHPPDIEKLEGEQYALVQRFFREFEPGKAHPGLIKPYRGPDEFEDFFNDHLQKWLDNLGDRLLSDSGDQKHSAQVVASVPRTLGPKAIHLAAQQHRDFTGRIHELQQLGQCAHDTGPALQSTLALFMAAAATARPPLLFNTLSSDARILVLSSLCLPRAPHC